MRTRTAQRRTDSAAPVRVQRYDRVQMPAALDPAARTAQGYLRTHAAVAVPGVMEYRDAAGNITLELLPPDELHDVESLRSLASLPITLGHPDEDVTPANVGALGVGTMGNEVEILEQSGHVRIGIVVHRGDALQAIDGGMVEVSPGYTTVIDPTPGVHPVFGRYDAIQRRRRYNHLAIVDEARGGDTVKLRADSSRQATRRQDAAPAGRRVATRHDLASPPEFTPRGFRMNKSLLLMAAMLSLPFAARADAEGTCHRTDTGAEISEEQLAAAIGDAIRSLQANQAPEPVEGADADDPEAMKARILELEGELAAMKKAKADADAEMAAEQEKADRATLDGLAERLRCDTSKWTDETDSSARRLDIARSQKLVAADDTPEAGVLVGMVRALENLHPDPAARADSGGSQWDAFRTDAGEKPRNDGGEGGWKGPRSRVDEATGVRLTGDRQKDAIAKRRAAARS